MIKSSPTMDQYREFCRLRDYRKPGVEVCQYTEAEEFAIAIGGCNEQRTETTVQNAYLGDVSP